MSPLQRSISAILSIVVGTSPLLPLSAGQTTVAVRESTAVPRAAVELLGSSQTEQITLQQAIKMALENNLEVKFENVGIGIERNRVRFSAGAFDPEFSIATATQSLRRLENINDIRSADVVRQREAVASNIAIAQQIFDQNNLARAASNLPPIPESERPTLSRDLTTNSLSTTAFDSQRFTNEAGLVGRTPWGMRYGFQIQANRYRNTFSGDTREIIPEYETVAQLTVVQPLLRNLGPDANLAELRIARLNHRIQVLEWKQRVNTTVQGVMAAYYDMAFALQNMRVRQEAIASGQRLVDWYRRRVELGFNSPIDIQQAEVQVSTDREQLIAARYVFLERQYQFKRLVLDEYKAKDGRIFVPADAPRLAPPAMDRTNLLRTAFERRFDYQQAVLTADAQNVRVRYAKNQLLPQLDLVASYGLNGLGTSFGNSIDQGLEGRTPSWSVGINFSIPLGNVQPRANYRIALGLKEQALLRIKQAEVAVGTDVDQVLSRIETSRQSVATAIETRKLAEAAVGVAFRRLEEGLISTFDIIEFQRRLNDARSRELNAQADLNRSITQLWLVTATAVDRAGVNFKEPKKPY